MKTSGLYRSGLAGVATALIFALFSCSSDEKSTMRVHLTDAPGNFDAVYIDVQEVNIHTSSNGWQTMNVNTGIYNLLDFTNGMDTLLGTATVPSGMVSQMRLVLGSNNSVVADGNSHPLTVPSGQTSGLKFNVHENLEPGLTYDIWIDFDAGRSIVHTGNDTYILKPVIRTYTQANSGGIKGIVSPLNVQTYVMAVAGGDTLGTYADASGNFLIAGAPAGTYTVTFTAAGFQVQLVNGVVVTVGNVTDMGTIVMLP